MTQQRPPVPPRHKVPIAQARLRPAAPPPPPTKYAPSTPAQPRTGGSGLLRARAPAAGVVQPAEAKKKQKKAVVELDIGGTPYAGESSGQYGHAEMSALRKFIVGFPTIAAASAALTAAAVKTVECHNQAVCGSCSMVLQALGFTAADAETEFSDEPSGGVSWGANMKVAELLTYRGLDATYKAAIKAGAK